MREPAVLSHLLHVHEADPVIHATVGSTVTQQTVDERLLEPASVRKKRGEEVRGSNVAANKNKIKTSFLEQVNTINSLLACFPQLGEGPCSNIPSVHLHSSAHG